MVKHKQTRPLSHEIQKSSQKKLSQREPLQDSAISKTGWKIIFFSLTTLIIGFVLLKFTNPEGNNWASIVSPVVILLSYIGIAIGIIYP